VLQSREWRQPIAHDHVSFLDRLQPGDSQQSRVSWAAADQDHCSDSCGLLHRHRRRRNGWHTVITSRRRYQLVTLRDTSGRYNQSSVPEIITRSRTPTHDQ
jgi:hypothetical protein